MPENLLHKLCASKNIFCASELQNQVFYSMLDQVYHDGKLTKSTTEVLADVQDGYYGLPYVKNTVSVLLFFGVNPYLLFFSQESNQTTQV